MCSEGLSLTAGNAATTSPPVSALLKHFTLLDASSVSYHPRSHNPALPEGVPLSIVVTLKVATKVGAPKRKLRVDTGCPQNP